MVKWDVERLCQAPGVFPADSRRATGMQALFYAGLPWKGRPTKVFAWMGFPRLEQDQTCPGIVLAHGGGGTAFDFWVRLWNERGYAAMAMDLCGCLPEPPPTSPGGERERHGEGGPPGWGGFDQLDEPVEDQWGYHAVADLLLAHSLLAAQPQVDAARIGLTGVSWGGFLTCIAAGVDRRLRFAAPVYGCGFLGDNPFWRRVVMPGVAEERQQRWFEQWDPSTFLGRATMPFCWVTGTNDFAFSLDILQRSYRLPPGERTLCLRVEMPHGHGGPGENPEEIRVFADGLLRGGERLARITAQGLSEGRVWATFEAERPIVRAELNFTRATGFWTDRKFNILPAAIAGERVEAVVPPLTTACFLNLFDDRGCVVSSEHVEL